MTWLIHSYNDFLLLLPHINATFYLSLVLKQIENIDQYMHSGFLNNSQ